MRIQLSHLVILLVYLLPLVLVYLLVRLGVRHGLRDAGIGRAPGRPQDGRRQDQDLPG
ncbi:hypothetical protein ACQE98_08370 [Ornithinimicrobium sp. W1679]|uniref:hypothetical protein n=1 Tax=unclassified Ornithinimicrobium TaxID=2615080 RepID=UPI003CECB7A6